MDSRVTGSRIWAQLGPMKVKLNCFLHSVRTPCTQVGLNTKGSNLFNGTTLIGKNDVSGVRETIIKALALNAIGECLERFSRVERVCLVNGSRD